MTTQAAESALHPQQCGVQREAAVSTLGSAALCALLPGHFAVPPSPAAWGLLLAAGLLGCGVQLLGTTALKLSRAAPTIAMSYIAGGALIFAGCQ